MTGSGAGSVGGEEKRQLVGHGCLDVRLSLVTFQTVHKVLGDQAVSGQSASGQRAGGPRYSDCFNTLVVPTLFFNGVREGGGGA